MSQPVSRPSWKEEVNRKLAAHQYRKGLSVVEQRALQEEHVDVSDRAAKAAERVAARFSNAPSYAEMQAAEARAALRDAEAATRAALEAQAAAHVALANLERFAEDQAAELEQERSEHANPSRVLAAASPSQAEADAAHEVQPPMAFDNAAHDAISHEEPHSAPHQQQAGPVAHEAPPATIVDAQPIHANLIHFPRELVATRRIRPRLAGAAAEQGTEDQFAQLSIFEVDPSSISIEPVASIAQEIAPAPSWSGPEWTSLDLEMERRAIEDDGEPPSIASRIHLAPLELRMMASLIDIALIVGLVCAGAAGIAGHLVHSPSVRSAELGSLAALVVIGLLYHAFFLIVTLSTPGMMYAGIGLCTFENEHPTREQLRGRLAALLISLLPVGLGMAWVIFDEDHLSWHDRISRTYLRTC